MHAPFTAQFSTSARSERGQAGCQKYHILCEYISYILYIITCVYYCLVYSHSPLLTLFTCRFHSIDILMCNSWLLYVYCYAMYISGNSWIVFISMLKDVLVVCIFSGRWLVRCTSFVPDTIYAVHETRINISNTHCASLLRSIVGRKVTMEPPVRNVHDSST